MTFNKISTFAFFFFLINLSYSQDSLECKSSHSVVANAKLNILYAGVDNPLLISSNEHKKFIVKIDKGKLIKEEDYYIARFTETGICKITLYDLKGKQFSGWQFSVEDVPTPLITIANQRKNTEVPRKIILSSPKLIPILENFGYECFFKVLSYRVNIINLNGDETNYNETGNTLTEEIKDCIWTLKRGEKVVFYDAELKLVNNIEFDHQFKAEPLELTIAY